MNFIMCAESCRWQRDGICTLEDITKVTCSEKGCCYFEAI